MTPACGLAIGLLVYAGIMLLASLGTGPATCPACGTQVQLFCATCGWTNPKGYRKGM
jgi:glycerol uptake facilitator-like aquaporin